MERGEAADLSTRMAEAHVAEIEGEEIGDELYKGVDEAIFSFTYLLPADAMTAIVRQKGRPPIFAALSGDQLYLATVADERHGSREVAIQCEAHRIRAGHDTVEAKLRFLGTSGPKAVRKTEWRFKIGESSLMIETHIHPDNERLSETEALAQALAGRLGCPLGEGAAEPLVAFGA